MLRNLLAVCFLFEAVTSKINSHGNTTAVYGGDAHYKCAMDDHTGVLQVTWQRLFSDNSVENLATYSSQYGLLVNEPFRGKVDITEASLGSMSIAVRNVTWGDESCYVCSFNAFPGGSTSSRTCLTVSGISEVTTDHVIVSGAESTEVLLSCSATGKPAPTIQWDVAPRPATSTQTQTTAVTHSDHTVTSSSNITLTAPAGWEGHVDCVLNGGTERRRTERIPVSLLDQETETGSNTSHLGTALSVCAVLIVLSIVAVLAFKLKRSKRSEEKTEEVI